MENCWTRKYEKTKIKVTGEFMNAWRENGLKICFSHTWLMKVLDIFYLDNEYNEQIDFPRLMCMLALISDGDLSSGGYWDIAREILTISEEEMDIWRLCDERHKYYNRRGERLLIGENIDVAIEDISRENEIPLQRVKEIWEKIERIKAKRIEGEYNES